MTKKSTDRLRDPALYLTMRDHATYPSTFLTYLCTICENSRWTVALQTSSWQKTVRVERSRLTTAAAAGCDHCHHPSSARTSTPPPRDLKIVLFLLVRSRNELNEPSEHANNTLDGRTLAGGAWREMRRDFWFKRPGGLDFTTNFEINAEIF